MNSYEQKQKMYADYADILQALVSARKVVETLEKIKAEIDEECKAITIGRFTINFNWEPNFCWGGYQWSRDHPDNFDGSPEHIYFDEVNDSIDSNSNHEEYVDDLIVAIAKNPFKTNENIQKE